MDGENIYQELTREFNQGSLRAVLSSGQAVVLYHLAIMSKDGDWILYEDAGTLDFILGVLESRGAQYRFGAPLDLRWMRGGWSSHFEFRHARMRVRTDFVTRPPRLSTSDLKGLWDEQSRAGLPVIGLRQLADIKKTNREKDYAVIGELARLMTDPRDRLLYSRSARELIQMAGEIPDLVQELTEQRPVLARIREGRDKIEEALDAERRQLMRVNEARLERYFAVSQAWRDEWKEISAPLVAMKLRDAHRQMVERAEDVLPFEP